jgi:hydroxypyruvate reductase
VGSIEQSVHSAAAFAEQKGLTVRATPLRFAEDAARLAVRFTHELHMNSNQVWVWGGESTVELPQNPGRGGRNQHLALAAAKLLAGHPDLMLLAVGTDGTDGVTDDAGALVDSDTCARIALAELDADDCLRRADSGTALAASGDLIHTGPTGTNVGDLVLGLKLSVAETRGSLERQLR